MMLLYGAIGSFLAIFSFSILLETPRKYLLHAGCIGAVGGTVYLFSVEHGAGAVLSAFFSAFAIAFMSHLFARIFKAPVIVFLVAGILPTVPGAGMYRIVYYMIAGDAAKSSYYFIQTLEIAGVIALAIYFVDMIFKLGVQWKKQHCIHEGEKR
jgi:uncharacterized membrane protein YjjB (DUF3815 family)